MASRAFCFSEERIRILELEIFIGCWIFSFQYGLKHAVVPRKAVDIIVSPGGSTEILPSFQGTVLMNIDITKVHRGPLAIRIIWDRRDKEFDVGVRIFFPRGSFFFALQLALIFFRNKPNITWRSNNTNMSHTRMKRIG